MKTRLTLGSALALALVLVLAGCGGGDDNTAQSDHPSPAPEASTASETPADATTVARHDCAGGCGMKNWPEDQMTEIDGKWYCAGCAKHVQTEETEEEEGHGDG